MKNLLTFGLLACVVISTSCKKGEAINPIPLDTQTGIATTPVHDSTYYVYPTGYTAKNAFLAPADLGTPAYLEAKNALVDQSLQSSINALLPSGVSVVSTHPDYVDSGALNIINVVAQTDVYITFVGQSTVYHNTLAYYTYPTGKPPVTNSGGSDNGAMDKITYIFPNVTSAGLISGNTVKMGNFKPGTSIAFVLIFNGWTGAGINNNNDKFYTQDNLNPETVNTLKRHAILLYNKIDNLFLLGFEDKNRQYGTCDNDFNDVLVYIKGTTANSISKTNVMPMTNDTDTGG